MNYAIWDIFAFVENVLSSFSVYFNDVSYIFSKIYNTTKTSYIVPYRVVKIKRHTFKAAIQSLCTVPQRYYVLNCRHFMLS